MVKRFFGWFLGIALLFALVFYSWLAYRQYRSFQSPIHQKAEALIRIQVDGIIRSTLGNIPGNLGYYRQRWKSSRGTSLIKEVKASGLKWPANVFIYSVKGVPNTWFTSLEVQDVVEFNSFLKSQWGIKPTHGGLDGSSEVKSRDGRFLAVFTAKRVVVAMAFRQLAGGARGVCADILSGRATIAVAESPFANVVKADKHHVLWNSAELASSLQFENGTMAFAATLRGGLVKGVASLRPKRFKENSLLKAWMDADVHRLVESNAGFLRSKGIPADSINRYYGGYLTAEWVDSTLLQQDTVVTYGYNDNFEKTEEHTVREERVPEFYLGIKGSPHLLEYLPPRLVYQLHSGHQQDLLYTGTGIRFSDERQTALTKDFFYFYADMARIRKKVPFSHMPTFVQSMGEVELHAQQKEDAIELKGHIMLPFKEINSLLQLSL